jgi:hypothetical protein
MAMTQHTPDTMHVRAYTSATRTPIRAPIARTRSGFRMSKHERPWGRYTFTFDSETTKDERQALRFGFYQIRGLPRVAREDLIARCKKENGEGLISREELARKLWEGFDSLIEEGSFYNPQEMTAEEIALLKDFAERHEIICRPLDNVYDKNGFLRHPEDRGFRDMLYQWVYKRETLCIGLNLPFDLSRLACAWKQGQDFYRNGFSMRLCECPYQQCFKHPRIRIKSAGRHKQFIAFQHSSPPNGAGKPARQKKRKDALDGRFLDVAQLGGALLGATSDVSLKGIAKAFKTPHQKLDMPETYGGRLTVDDLRYARNDVQVTWEVYQALRDLYRKHDLGTAMWRIYSEASIGKAYMHDMGVPPPSERLDLPPEILGHTMTALYAGRSEVLIRHLTVEIEYCDFKSQYPTANALLGLQELWLAKSLSVDDVTAEIQQFLAAHTIESLLTFLRAPANWKRLRVICKVRPRGDRLPVRADYGGDGRNIALTVIEYGPHCYWTLLDVIASFLLTGKAPAVMEAFRFTPHGSIANQTKAITLFGDPNYTIDLRNDDLFTRVIDLRTKVKRETEAAERAGDRQDAARLKGIEQGLKLLANATSYGIFIEMNEDKEGAEAQAVSVYGLSAFTARVKVVEKPGTYFFAPCGVLIPAGGRLLLAIAEALGKHEGLGYAFMDTDSIAFARPHGMKRKDFYTRCARVRGWFDALSPYEGKPPLLECEDENEWAGEREPLYFVGVSAKRYALWNQLLDGTYRIRKFSAHGLGSYPHLRDYQPHDDVPAPYTLDDDGKPDSHQLGGPRWVYDLWYDFIRAAETGKDGKGDPVTRGASGELLYTPRADGLEEAFAHQVTVRTWKVYEQQSADYSGGVHDLRPFNFISVLPALTGSEAFGVLGRTTQMEEGRQWLKDYQRGAFFGPHADSAVALARLHADGKLSTMQDNRPVPVPPYVELLPLVNAVLRHFTHAEAKAEHPHGASNVGVRSVRLSAIALIGKETSRAALPTMEESDGLLGMTGEDDEAQVFGPDSAAFGASRDWRTLLEGYALTDLLLVTGVPERTLSKIRGGQTKEPDPETARAILSGLPLLDPANPDTILGWRKEVPNATVALALRVARGDIHKESPTEDELVFVREVRSGKRHLLETERLALIAAIQCYQRVRHEEEDDSPMLAE